VEKRARLMKAYGWSEKRVAEKLDGAQGWVWFNWALENEASVWGSGIERKGDGYVKQETKRILERMNDGRV
jgi:hypothetical protein